MDTVKNAEAFVKINECRTTKGRSIEHQKQDNIQAVKLLDFENAYHQPYQSLCKPLSARLHSTQTLYSLESDHFE